MLSPNFWYKESLVYKIYSNLLLPLSACWYIGSKLRYLLSKPVTLPIPVICVGNVTAGGVGKTPTVIEIAKYLKGLGYNPFILLRGYKGKCLGPIIVNDVKHNILQVGDEALLLAKYFPTCVSKNRAKGAKLIIKEGGDIIIMDDGLQNNHIHKDFSLLLIDGEVGIGNKRMIPAGPLREKITTALKKIDMIMIIGNNHFYADWMPKNIKIIHGNFIPMHEYSFKKANLIAFSGIGRPEKFFNMLKKYEPESIECHSFPDHHIFSDKEIKSLINKAILKKARLVTTLKDAVRLPDAIRKEVEILDVYLDINPKIEECLPIKNIVESKSS